MIGDVRLPRRVLEADTNIVSSGLEELERTSWSKQHTHKFGGSHDELATVADYDKFAESFGHITIPLSQERPDHDLRERTLQF